MVVCLVPGIRGDDIPVREQRLAVGRDTCLGCTVPTHEPLCSFKTYFGGIFKRVVTWTAGQNGLSAGAEPQGFAVITVHTNSLLQSRPYLSCNECGSRR